MEHAIYILSRELSNLQACEQVHRAVGGNQRADEFLRKHDETNTALAALQCFQAGHLTPPETFEGKIAAAINHHSLENGSDTPDFILAQYLKRCLENFDLTMQQRAAWYAPQPPDEDVEPPKQEYRMMEVGELICNGDEHLSDHHGWRSTEAPGYTVMGCMEGRYRRPL